MYFYTEHPISTSYNEKIRYFEKIFKNNAMSLMKQRRSIFPKIDRYYKIVKQCVLIHRYLLRGQVLKICI